MKIKVQRIGNSRGIIIPKPLLDQLDISGEVELELESDSIVLRKARHSPRAGWAEDCKMLAEHNETALLWPEFSNEADATFKW